MRSSRSSRVSPDGVTQDTHSATAPSPAPPHRYLDFLRREQANMLKFGDQEALAWLTDDDNHDGELAEDEDWALEDVDEMLRFASFVDAARSANPAEFEGLLAASGGAERAQLDAALAIVSEEVAQRRQLPAQPPPAAPAAQ